MKGLQRFLILSIIVMAGSIAYAQEQKGHVIAPSKAPSIQPKKSSTLQSTQQPVATQSSPPVESAPTPPAPIVTETKSEPEMPAHEHMQEQPVAEETPAPPAETVSEPEPRPKVEEKAAEEENEPEEAIKKEEVKEAPVASTPDQLPPGELEQKSEASKAPVVVGTPKAELKQFAKLKKDTDNTVNFTLSTEKGEPLVPDLLQLVHESKIHLLIVDDMMTDYQHTHPTVGAGPGQYTFSFVPRTNHSYSVWVDITPVGGKEETLKLALPGESPCTKDCVITDAVDKATSKGVNGVLEKKSGMYEVTLSDAKGPVKNLEPLMGAYAHIVAFKPDGSGVSHVHPMGDAPKESWDRGGPKLTFHMEGDGPLKVFVQISRDRNDIVLPFTVDD
jgi:hypothetical protein